jgi:hypothetical protein
MSNYDVEMVKKFATLNKELIEKTAKDHPEIGGLIKQIIESITEESTNTSTNGVLEEDELMWKSIPQAEDLKDFYKNKTITEQLEAVGRFMGSKKSSNLTLKEISDMVISMFLMGNFYQLSNEPSKREEFNEKYNQNLEDYETAILYKPTPKLKELLGNQINTVVKDFVFHEKLMENIASYLSIRAGLSDEELQNLSDTLTNITIFNFLKNLGKDGFWYEDEASWFIPKVVAGVGVVLNDELGNKLEFDPDFLRVELGIKLFPAPQPKFSMGDKVVLEKPTNRKGEVGTIVSRSWISDLKKYEYSVQLEKQIITNSTMTYGQTTTIIAKEDELEKYTKSKSTIKQNSTIIENLEVYNEDLGQMNWKQAQEKIKKLGNNWRLPTKEEFRNILYPNKNKIPNLKEDNLYWSYNDVGDGVWQNLPFSFTTSLVSVRYRLQSPYYVLPVRDLSNSTTQTPKSTLPTPTTPEELEISQMSKEQLKQLKEEFEETLTYLEDGDPEKNDLLGQIKFLNLYLEN